MARLSFVFSVFLVVSGLSATTALAAPPPVEAFGKREAISDVIMSPGGTHFAALQWVKGKEVLAVYNPFATDPADKLRMISLHTTRIVEERIEDIFWLNDETIGLVYQWEGLRASTPVAETRLIAAKVDLSDTWQVPRPSKGANVHGQIQHRILDYLDDDPEHILMELDVEGYGAELNVYKVNIARGSVQRVTKGGARVYGYLADQNGEPRLRWSYSKQKAQVHHREPGSLNWSLVFETGRGELFDLRPISFDSNPNHLFVSHTTDSGFSEVLSYDLETRSVIGPAFSVPGHDVKWLSTDRYTGAVTGFAWAEHYNKEHYIDPDLQQVQKSIDQALSRTRNVITSYDRKRSRFIILASSPSDPGTYFLYLRDQGKISRIGSRGPMRINPAEVGTMKPVTYTARDGTEIPAYLTTPNGKSGPFPLVVMPHGGPTSRTYMTWDYEVQFLASRGYAVLQPNFRGSSGYGRNFQEAGYGQWGMLMQDDVTDGAKAMIERGVADPNRMCIVGSSYGGYAALMGAVVTPDLFKCASSFAGVTDIIKLIKQGERYKFATSNPPNVGSRKDDRDQLRETSPIKNIDAISIPILLMHGDKDLSVNVSQSKRMASALKRAGKPQKLVIFKKGNHHLQLEEHRLRYLKELEAFLAQHIGK